MNAIIALIVFFGLIIMAGAMVWSEGRKSGKMEAGEDELKADYEVKKARDRLNRDPAERKRLRDHFR